MNWKQKLIKSGVYRVLSIFLGFIIGFAITGSISTAFWISLLSEGIQFFNYFGFELAWNKIDEKWLREEIGKEFKEREIGMRLTMSSILDIAREFSQIDTFVPKVYQSILSFFKTTLRNKQLKEFHAEIRKLQEGFEITHRGRGF